MDSRLLRSFIEVASLESVSKAAVRLGYSQPTVTQHIQQFEHLVGGRLIIRVAGGVAVTDLGSRVLPLARVALMALDELSSCHQPRTRVLPPTVSTTAAPAHWNGQ